MAPGAVAFELTVPVEASPRAIRACGLAGVRAVPVSCEWHDTVERALEGRGLALAEWRGRGLARWRLERRWDAPGQAARPLAEAMTLSGLAGAPEAPVAAVGGFAGRMRAGMAGTVEVMLLAGAMRAGALSAPCCRVRLEGPAGAVAALADELAGVAGAAGCAPLAAWLGGPRPIRPVVPVLEEAQSASDALATVCGHLAAAIAAQAGPAAAAAGPEPVHQMRVAVRRLRSALRLFREVGAGPELEGAADALRALGHALGPARDWDVFLGGVGRVVGAAFPDDAGVARLLAAAGRRREEAYAALRTALDGAAFRRLGIKLALAAQSRPWEPGGETPALRAFAAAALGKRWRRLLAPGRDIAGLEPERLHAIRLEAKRARYAAELFAPLWGRQASSRFIRRVTALQEALGHLNDAAVAAALMSQLGAAGRGRAGGIVVGLVAARAAGSREKIESCWRKLRRTEVFWV